MARRLDELFFESAMVFFHRQSPGESIELGDRAAAVPRDDAALRGSSRLTKSAESALMRA